MFAHERPSKVAFAEAMMAIKFGTPGADALTGDHHFEQAGFHILLPLK